MQYRHYLSAVAIVLTSLSSSRAWADAEVIFSSGPAFTIQNNASTVLKATDRVDVGQTLKTGANGFLYIRLEDGGLFVLRPNSEGKIVRFKQDAQNPTQNEIQLELKQGTARVVTGSAAKAARERFRMNTPVAAIGVRGTDFTVYTDQQITRTVINSGAITISGFNTNCSREALGPCSGQHSLTLSAQDHQRLAEIRREWMNPKLLDNEQLNPEKVSPKGNQEPHAQNNSSGEVVSSTVSKEPVTMKALLATPEPTPMVNWGRWSAIAQIPANVDIFKVLEDNNVQLMALSSNYAIYRNKQVVTDTPASGQVSFNLKNSEAYFVTPAGAQSATVSNGTLNMNFATRQFNTSLDIANAQYNTNFSASGDIESNGALNSNTNTLSRVAGSLGGPLNNQAAYLFLRQLNNSLTVQGATYWSR